MQILPDTLLNKVDDNLDSFRVSVSDGKGFALALDRSLQEVRESLRDDGPRDDGDPRSPRSRVRNDGAASDAALEQALLAGAPYNPVPELLSPFAPGPVRLTEKETNALIDAMRADGAPARALSAMREAGRYPGGATADQLILAARNALEGAAPVLSRQEEALLQSLALKAAGDQGAELNTLFSSGTPQNALKTLMAGLAESPVPVSISRDEMAALARALRLPEGTARALLDGFHGENSLTLSGREWNEALSQARAQLDQNAADMDSLLSSLERHMPPVLRDASRREETERLAGMREDKSVSQARELIRDRATAAAPGREDRVDPDSQTRAAPRREENRAQSDETGRPAAREDSVATPRQTQESPRAGERTDGRAAQARPLNDESPLRDARPAERAERSERPGGQNDRADGLTGRDGVNAASEANARAAGAANSAPAGAEQAADGRIRPGRDEPADLSGQDEREENAGFRDSDADHRASESFAGSARSAVTNPAATPAASPAAAPLYAAVAQGVDTVIPQASPQAGPQTRPDARAALPAQTLEQIEQAVLSAHKNGVQRLELALTPGDLGSMTVVLTTRHGEVSALIQPERAETAALIAEQVEQIRAQLENQGFRVEKVDVQTQLADQQSPDWQGAEQHNASRDLAAQVEHLERLRRLSRSSSSTGSDLSGDSATLARDMHLQARQATVAGHGLHIIA
ncbi:MAG: flagellar hook-length control protein FliK [Desulfovibrionaceae bacterium]|nr:flagellar hook-length control protein FliK [Desulfovibrionaceae bacterium]